MGLSQVGSRNPVLDGGADPTKGSLSAAESGGLKEPCIRWGCRSPKGKRQLLGIVHSSEMHWEPLLWCTRKNG